MSHVQTSGRVLDLNADEMQRLGYQLSVAMRTNDIASIQDACVCMDYTGKMPGVVLHCAAPFDADIAIGTKTFDARVIRWYNVADGLVVPDSVHYVAHEIAAIEVGDLITFESTVDEPQSELQCGPPSRRAVRRQIVRILGYVDVAHGKMSDGYAMYGEKLISKRAAICR